MAEVSNARTDILAHIKSAIGVAPHGSPDESWPAIPRDYQQCGRRDPAACIALLEDRLRDYGAGVHQAAAPEVASAIAKVLHQRNKQRVLVPVGLEACWLPQDFTFVRDENLSYAQLDACEGVLTGCTLAIALTGTLVLCHNSQAPAQQAAGRRALTLVPDYHLCVVQVSSVVETVPEAFRLLEAHKHQPITFISGPSATADIEMTRIQGVHGPRTLDVLLVS
jgi:L-lactate dehydrogenase complex protein LldG